jgi:hypothetical protein
MADEGSDEADVREQLTVLGALKAQLDDCDAQLTGLVPTVEAMLDSLHIGVPVSLQIGAGEDWTTYLSFTKVGKRWRFCVETGPDNGDAGDWTVTPLSDVARDKRAEIFQNFIPGILDAAAKEVKKRIEQRRLAIKSTQSLVQKVGNVLAEQTRTPGTHFYTNRLESTGPDKDNDDAESPTDHNPGLGEFGQGHPGMKVTSDMPSEVLKKIELPKPAKIPAAARRATLGTPGRKL